MRTYAFLTTDGYRWEATARNAREAYRKAKASNSVHGFSNVGTITKEYIRYAKDGLVPIYSWQTLK